jgi:hypothetical protein
MTVATPLADILLSLADRCEAATGPDRKLDVLIRCAVHPGYEFGHHAAKRLGTLTCHYASGGHSTFLASSYTASLDAAMPPIGFARVILNIAEDGITLAIVDGTQGIGNTPALAVLAACLRVRAYRARAAESDQS